MKGINKKAKDFALGLICAVLIFILMQLRFEPVVVGQIGAFIVAGAAMWRVFKRPPAGWFLTGFVIGCSCFIVIRAFL
jgi:hypothetical protein